MKKIFTATFLVLVLMGAGCSGGTEELPSRYGTAFDYQFGIVVDSLDSAINDTDIDSLAPYQGYASFAAKGLPGIIEIAEDSAELELAAELKTLNTELNAAIDSATTLAELKANVQPFVDEMVAIQNRE